MHAHVYTHAHTHSLQRKAEQDQVCSGTSRAGTRGECRSLTPTEHHHRRAGHAVTPLRGPGMHPALTGLERRHTRSSLRVFTVGSRATSFTASICSSMAFSCTSLNSYRENGQETEDEAEQDPGNYPPSSGVHVSVVRVCAQTAQASRSRQGPLGKNPTDTAEAPSPGYELQRIWLNVSLFILGREVVVTVFETDRNPRPRLPSRLCG